MSEFLVFEKGIKETNKEQKTKKGKQTIK